METKVRFLQILLLLSLFTSKMYGQQETQEIVIDSSITNQVSLEIPKELIIIFKRIDRKGRLKYSPLSDPTGKQLNMLRNDANIQEVKTRYRRQFWKEFGQVFRTVIEVFVEAAKGYLRASLTEQQTNSSENLPPTTTENRKNLN